MKNILAIVLVMAFVLAIAAPAFAQSVMHTVEELYEDATIDIERQAGHVCNTGAELKYTVKGSVTQFAAERSITQVENKITVNKDDAAWVAGATPLTVTSVIELCAPAKHSWEAGRRLFVFDEDQFGVRELLNGEEPGALLSGSWVDVVMASGDSVDPWLGYPLNWGDRYWLEGSFRSDLNGPFLPSRIGPIFVPGGFTAPGQPGFGEHFWGPLSGDSLFSMVEQLVSDPGYVGRDIDDLVLLASDPVKWELFLRELFNYGRRGGIGGYNYLKTEALTEQIWAVQVQSDPGFSGNLEQSWEAAYGGWNEIGGMGKDPAYSLIFPGAPDQWGFVADDKYAYGVEFGADFVGNYFNMEQHARTSQGTLKRYIDISSPWSHAFVSEDSTITGQADIEEAFSMVNLSPGSDIVTDWYDLF